MAKQTNDDLRTADVLWNLNDLYSAVDDPQITTDLSTCHELARQINADYIGRVASLSPDQLLNLIQQLEELSALSGRLASYAVLNFTTQVSNPQAGAFLQKIQEELSQIAKLSVFFELELCALAPDQATTLLADDDLAHFRHYLLNIRRFSPHMLSQTEESLLLEIAPVSTASWNTLFEKVLTKLKFGKDKRSEEEVLSDLYAPDRQIRQQAAHDLTVGLASQLHVLTHIFNTILADKMISDRLRHYDSWDSAIHLTNELHASTVNTLSACVVSRYDIVQRYYQLKTSLLGLDKLYDYDRYAPLPHLPDQQIDWPGCQEIVLTTFASFSPKMAEIASFFFDRQWIHAPLLPDKQGGAFAHPCIPQVHPYVMVNYTGNIRDIATVAHELGHGIHQYLAAPQGYFNADTPLVLAETASVFAELLLFHTQLELLSDEKQRRAFTCQKLESIFATVFRQVSMNRFETRIHNHRREKGELSPDDFNHHWRQTQIEMFADSVELGTDYDCWWAYIPHFLATPGYVYSYAFGELLVLALYKHYQETGPDFVLKYEHLLQAGGSLSPYKLVKPFGIDLDDASFWHGGLALIDDMLSSISPP